jgi:hypothetical protein
MSLVSLAAAQGGLEREQRQARLLKVLGNVF